jgi:hypothetical protein
VVHLLETRGWLTWSAVIVAVPFLLQVLVVVGCSWARTPKAAPAAPAGTQLTIDVREPAGLARHLWPVSAGVSFAPGFLKDAQGLSVLEGTTPSALQTRVLSRWPDGSARWALLDWQADLGPRQTRRWRVGTGSTAPEHAVKVTDGPDRVDVDTGPLQFSIAKDRFAPLTAVRLNGAAVLGGPVTTFFEVDGKRIEPRPPASLKVTEPGPLRVRIELRGPYSAEFEYVVRIDAFANQPFVRVFHTFEQRSPQPYTSVRQLAIAVPLKFDGPVSYSAGREKGPPFTGVVQGAGFTLIQDDNETLHAGAQPYAQHAAGWIDVHDAAHGVALAARFFWQEYPQSFELRPAGLTYNLWAPGAPPAKVGMGTAKTHEMILYFHGAAAPTPQLLAALSEPLVGTVDARWTAATGALANAIAPNATTEAFLRALGRGYHSYQKHADVERWDDNGEVRCPPPSTPTAGTPGAAKRLPERPRRGFYGMFNWGDWNFPGYHDTTKGCDAWGNLEYDMTQVLALAYAATGEREYYEGMVAAARHFMDVDRIYYQRARPAWVGMNHPKNPLHFAFELGGVDLGHTWTEGLLSYYYLTGDERGLEAARGIADYLVRRSRTAALRGNPRQWGWPQIALVAAYEATGDADYKAAALVYARGGMAAFPADKSAGWKMGLLADGLAYTHSLTQEPAIREWLSHYAAVVRGRGDGVDPRFLPALAYTARLRADAEQMRMATAAVARLKFGNWGKPFTIAGRIGFRILSLNTPPPLPQETRTPGGKDERPE